MELTKHYLHEIKPADINKQGYLWMCEKTPPFDELLLTWNGARPPLGGSYFFRISVKLDAWSEWLPYAFWASDKQGGAEATDREGAVSTYQDLFRVHQGKQAQGFRIEVEAIGGASIADLFALHACVSLSESIKSPPIYPEGRKIQLDVPLISQFLLPHPRKGDLCSPTATSAALSLLLRRPIDPLSMALGGYDHTGDIFGNWALNIAHASFLLGKQWRCWVQRLNGFHEIHQRLTTGIPVVVSVKGPLRRSALPYENGHLLVVKGYDACSKSVLCMDPAFPSHEKTEISYDLKDFLDAWGRRRCLAYLFERALKPRFQGTDYRD